MYNRPRVTPRPDSRTLHCTKQKLNDINTTQEWENSIPYKDIGPYKVKYTRKIRWRAFKRKGTNMLPLVLLMCQMWLKVNTIAIQLNMDALEVTHVTKPVSSRAEASFEPSAFSFRFLVFWALVIGGLIPIVDIVCYTWEQLRMVAFSSKMNLKTSWNWSFVLSIWLFERHFQENCLNRKNK